LLRKWYDGAKALEDPGLEDEIKQASLLLEDYNSIDDRDKYMPLIERF
jgi:hypothetical protein